MIEEPHSEFVLGNLFSEAIALRDDGKLEPAKRKLFEIIQMFEPNPKLCRVYVVLAGILYHQKLFPEALKFFEMSGKLESDYELASLGMYLSWVEMKHYDLAIREMDRFLSLYPADLYKTTLEELIEDLKDGFARDFESIIIRHAKKHGVPIVD